MVPKANVYASRALPGVLEGSEIPAFDEMPPDPSVVFKGWRTVTRLASECGAPVRLCPCRPLPALMGETFMLATEPVRVHPLTNALSVDTGQAFSERIDVGPVFGHCGDRRSQFQATACG